MATQKGKTSRMQIYETAKRLFYEKGYLDTTIKEIAEKADAKVGTVTYYYHKKEELFYEIYQEMIDKVYAFIDDRQTGELSVAEKFMYFITIFFQIVMNDDANRRVVYEIQVNKSMEYFYEEPLTLLVNEVIKEQHDLANQAQLEMFALSYFGIHRQLCFYYLEGDKNITFDEFKIMLLRTTGLFFGLSRKEINDVTLSVESFVKENDLSEIRFLV